MPVNLTRYAAEVEGGLPAEKLYMDAALERQAFYDFEGARYADHFRRDAETTWDHQSRSKRTSGFLRECVEKLCSHLYAPGPARKWSEDAGNEFLAKVYQDNNINSLMLESDKLSTLNGVCAIQIDAGEGDFAKRPITYRIWGREQLAVWCDPDSASTPIVCCTRDMYDTQMRYRLWSDTEVWTFTTDKQKPGLGGGRPTAGGTAPILRTKETHDYGTLPFTFVHYALPIRDFDVTPIGEFLWKAEIHVDDRLMRLDESISKYINPVPYAKGVPPDWKPLIQPMRFIRLPGREPIMTDSGIQDSGDSEMGFLEAHIDIAGAWDDLERFITQCLDAAGIPKTSVRMEPIAAQSGIALMVEQEPLIRRAETRRPMFQVYEEDLARRTLVCAGNHYGKTQFVTETEQGHVSIAWPAPRLSINTPDKMEMGIAEVQNGLKSHLMLVMDWYNVGRETALEIMQQIKEDQDETAKLYPEAVAVNAPEDPEQKAAAEHERMLALVAAKQGNGEA